MKTSPNHLCDRLTARDTEKLIREIVRKKIQESFRMAGVSWDSPPRRRHDRLTRRVLRMIKQPVQTWDIGLLDELLDAQADMRARLQGLEAFAAMSSPTRAS